MLPECQVPAVIVTLHAQQRGAQSAALQRVGQSCGSTEIQQVAFFRQRQAVFFFQVAQHLHELCALARTLIRHYLVYLLTHALLVGELVPQCVQCFAVRLLFRVGRYAVARPVVKLLAIAHIKVLKIRLHGLGLGVVSAGRRNVASHHFV